MIVRTHDDARALIRECTGGLAVRFERPRDRSSASATQYTLYHPSHPSKQLNTCDVYTLPFLAETTARGVRALAQEAAKKLSVELKGTK